ncbi:MAG: hypothetical protein GYA24_03095 [Candidatus Lokiarchaeota archaeon]|nr:hypothetical protein [Candidatus Lokiarchaeota archaeon]
MTNADSNQERHGIITREFLAGVSGAPILLFTFIVVPWIVDQLFTIGLSDTSLVIVACAIPIIFCTLFLVMLPRPARDLVHAGSSIAAGLLATLLGLVFSVGYNDASIPAAIATGVYLVSGFVAVYLDVLAKDGPRSSENDKAGDRSPRHLAHGLGLIFPAVLAGFLMQVTAKGPMVLFVMSIIHVLALLCRVASRPVTGHDATIASQVDTPPARDIGLSRHHATNLENVMLLLLVLPAMFMFSAFTNVLATDLRLSGYEYLAIGVLVSFSLWDHAWLPRVVVPWACLGLFWTFMVGTLASGFDWGIRLAGLVAGIVSGEIVLKARSLPRSPRHSTEGLVLFFMLVLVVLGAALGTEYLSIVGDEEMYQWIPIAFLGITGAIVAALTIVERFALGNKVAPVLLREFLKPVVHDARSVPSRNKMAAVLLVGLIAIPLLGTMLGANTNTQVHVDLGTTMYDVHGNEVTSVDLRAGTAKILFSTPSPSGTPHGELIRPGKSVRIGGYYYGYQNSTDKPFTRDQVIDWVGHNNDVFSFGFMGTGGNSMTPENITAIRSINNQARFYYMAFATTLFEDAGSPGGTGPTWGNIHYPNVQFNATIHDMTLKLANGSEAIGVRRTRNGDSAHLMDLGNMAWADYFAWIYENRSKQFHANGVAIDEVMWEGYWDVDKKNGGVPLRDYTTKDQIRATCYDWLERIDSKMSVEIMTQAFWPESQIYQQGVWGEIAFRAGGIYGRRVDDRKDTVWYNIAPMNWMDIVGNMNGIANQNKSYIWAAWYEPGDMEGLEYAIATYMMGKPNNCTCLVFQPHPGHYPEQNLVGYAVRTVKDEVEAHPELFDIELGDALGTMELRAGGGGQYYQRTFQNGIVLVNPFHARVPGF